MVGGIVFHKSRVLETHDSVLLADLQIRVHTLKLFFIFFK